jgi:hypothetical protein
MLKTLIFVVLFGTLLSTIVAQDLGNNVTIKNSKYLIRSTVGSSGQTGTIKTTKGSYFISQSIGQASVIGTFSKNKYTIRQGFQQPLISAEKVNVLDVNSLRANLYPNPFQQSINVLFEDRINDELSVKVYHFSGGILTSKKYPPAQLLNISLDFLPAGNYILIINSGNKQLRSKIIEQ